MTTYVVQGAANNRATRGIKRLIFETTEKFNGEFFDAIPSHQIRQIAGRAGRFSPVKKETSDDPNNQTQSQHMADISPTRNLGLVTTMEQIDLPRVMSAMRQEPEPLMSAGILPPSQVIARFANFFPPGTPFSYILLRLHELSLIHPRFHICDLRDAVRIADAIEPIENLTISDRIIFCESPASTSEETIVLQLPSLAKCVANHSGGALLDIPTIDLNILNLKSSAEKAYLSELELLHKSLVLYLWLSYRFPGVFTTQAMAIYVKGLIEKKIDEALANVSLDLEKRKLVARKRERAMFKNLGFQDQIVDEDTLGESANLVEEGMVDASRMSAAGQSPDTYVDGSLSHGLLDQALASKETRASN